MSLTGFQLNYPSSPTSSLASNGMGVLRGLDIIDAPLKVESPG
jgi:hypothetical protein